jgi:ABC-type bacteriocin/lantibiotic exporter with double-glycine peptidase domain
MAENLLPVHPLNSLDALSRILELKGCSLPMHQLLEICGPDPTPEIMARCMEYRELQARAVKIDGVHVSRLDTPTLLLLKEHQWLVLRSTKKGKYEVEGAEGEIGILSEEGLKAHFEGLTFDLLPCLPEGGLWQRVLRLLASQRKSFYPVIGVVALAQLLGLVTPLLTGAMVDQVFPQGARSLFHIVVAGSLLMALFDAWLGWVQQKYLLYIETRVNAILERGLLNHLLRLPYDFLQTKTVGQLMQGFSGLSAAKDLVTGEVLGSLFGGISAAVYLVAMVKLMPSGTGFVIIMTLFFGVSSVLVAFYQARLQRLQIDTQAAYQSYMVELLSGVPTIKAAGAESRILDRWVQLLRKDRLIGLFSGRIGMVVNSGFGFLGQIQSVVLLMWGGKLVVAGDVKLGELLAFTMMAGGFQSAIQGFFSAFIRVWMMRPYLEISRDILERKKEAPVAPASHRALNSALVVEDLWFRYGAEGPWVVQGQSFTVKPGEIHHIEGPSGSGKSTMLRLIAGLHTPDRGRVRMESGEDLPSRSLCIYLPQFVQLLNGSVIDNLKLLSGGADRERLMRTAKATGLSEIVAELPMGFETLVSSGGGNFSGGQRQLIALTAVLASDRPILLLDEAMSNLDSLRRASLMKSDLFAQKTVLFASHDGGLATS